MITIFEYTICTNDNVDIFRKQCAALERYIDGLEWERNLTDVDGSQIQTYLRAGCRLSVINDMTLHMVLIRSEFDIDPFFKKLPE